MNEMVKMSIDGRRNAFFSAYEINDDCVNCGACVPGCPVSAITEGDGKMVVDADLCVDCGACASVCPVGAPVAQ